MWYTVVYTSGFQHNLVNVAHIESNGSGDLFKAAEDAGIDPCAIVHVFECKHESIESDWSKL